MDNWSNSGCGLVRYSRLNVHCCSLFIAGSVASRIRYCLVWYISSWYPLPAGHWRAAIRMWCAANRRLGVEQTVNRVQIRKTSPTQCIQRIYFWSKWKLYNVYVIVRSLLSRKRDEVLWKPQSITNLKVLITIVPSPNCSPNLCMMKLNCNIQLPFRPKVNS